MKKERSDKFYSFLHDIEYEIGSECYNGSIQNFGPGGEWEGEGRDFRYPVTFINSEGLKEKYKGVLPFTRTEDGDFCHCLLGKKRYSSAFYAFGANQLYILRGVKNALEQIEKRFGIDFDELLESEDIDKNS
ncbi:MAG: hypothetical protein LAT61_12750 [Alcanivorax sp.]|nr:hypothetical protein [Alcanivorax sp.]